MSICRSLIQTRFPVGKKANDFRVFVLGESQAMGTPYVHQTGAIDPRISTLLGLPQGGGIPTWLEENLSQAFPEKHVQVINAAAGSSDLLYALNHLLPWILSNGQADLIIFHFGNNERSDYRIDPGSLRWRRSERSNDSIPVIVKTLGESFGERLAQALAATSRANVDTMLISPAVNIREWWPARNMSQWPEKRYQAFLGLIEQKQWQSIRTAISKDDVALSAEANFFAAKAYEGQGKYEDSYALYERAADLDESFLRVRTPWRDQITARRTKALALVDLQQALRPYAKHNIPGMDIFVDYCHLQLWANVVAANSITSAYLKAKGFPARQWTARKSIDLDAYTRARLNMLHMVKWFKWTRYKFFQTSGFLFSEENLSLMAKHYADELLRLEGNVRTLASVPHHP